MNGITTIFFDIGNVLLTNGWDTDSRKKSAAHFSFDFDEYQKHHEQIVNEFERGNISLDKYLSETIFYKERDFSKDDFIEFMKGESKPYNENIAAVEKIRKNTDYLLATINNESYELNNYRLKKFKLDRLFAATFSSSYMRVRKPDKDIYDSALKIIHKKPGECLYIDDRSENIETAEKIGIKTLHTPEPDKIPGILKEKGIID